MKIVNEHHMSVTDLSDLEFVPHQNEHMPTMNLVAERVFACLIARPVTIVAFDAPLLITCDEPVLLPVPDRFAEPSAKELASAPQRVAVDCIRQEDLIHFQSRAGVGMASSDEVVMPLTPRSALLYGLRNGPDLPVRHQLQEAQARAFADDMVDLCLDENDSKWGHFRLAHSTRPRTGLGGRSF